MKLSLSLVAIVIAAVLSIATLSAAVEDVFNAEDSMAAQVAAVQDDPAAAVQEEYRNLSDSYSLDVQDTSKCGDHCSSHKDCGDNCSTCHKKTDKWGNAKKYGSCIEKKYKKEKKSYEKKKSAVKEDCYCRKNKKYCHVCTEKKWGTKKCSYKMDGECKKSKTNNWDW
jgi:hypothetical protein